MREIKFRQFINGKFHYWGLVSNGVFNGMARYEDSYPESQQFTGLKDKNGKEIYEGDIVKNGMGDTYKIESCVGGFECFDNENRCWMFSVLNRDCEVIGNIYENQELLK